MSPFLTFILDLETAINQKMVKEDHGFWSCSDCEYRSQKRGNLYEHIEAKHVTHPGYQCSLCHVVSKTSASQRMHFRKYHNP